MSRVDYDDYDEIFPNRWAFWQRAFERARDSKRGLKAMEDVRAALLALPEKRLISSALCTVGKAEELARQPDPYGERGDLLATQGEGVCLVGAYAWHKRVEQGMTPDEAFRSLPLGADYEGDPEVTANEGERAGLAQTLAWHLMTINDEYFGGMTPEARYDAILHHIEDKIARHPAREAVAS
jgi:hypothetical protein